MLARRAAIVRAVRAFFEAEAFLEVQTPMRLRAPLPERHIDAVPADGMYLATSPEPHMKRLLAAGHPRIVQLSPCFRKGERGARHLPEFTMLEWYRAEADYLKLITDAQALLRAVCQAVCGSSQIVYQGTCVNIAAPWEFLTVDDAYQRHADWRLASAPDAFRFDCAMARTIEPHLGLGQPTVLHQYPLCFCPMAAPLADRPDRAARCEIYVAGLELANGCTERRDPAAQTAALRDEQAARRATQHDVYPWPDAFVAALPALPPCAGMALGLDRLVMLLCDAPRIEDVVAFVEE
jgi:lysyl-tRNA synthetase class 2